MIFCRHDADIFDNLVSPGWFSIPDGLRIRHKDVKLLNGIVFFQNKVGPQSNILH